MPVHTHDDRSTRYVNLIIIYRFKDTLYFINEYQIIESFAAKWHNVKRKAFRECNEREPKNKSHIIETAVEQYIIMCAPFYGRNVLHTNKNTCSGIAWQRLLAQTSCCGHCCFLLHYPNTNRITNSPFRLFRHRTSASDVERTVCAHFSICSRARADRYKGINLPTLLSAQRTCYYYCSENYVRQKKNRHF